jgi:hypothetical protein
MSLPDLEMKKINCFAFFEGITVPYRKQIGFAKIILRFRIGMLLQEFLKSPSVLWLQTHFGFSLQFSEWEALLPFLASD